MKGEKTAGKKRQRRAVLSIKGKGYLAGIYEHPTRHAPDKSTAQLHAEVAKGALEDAGLTKADIDGYFCAAAARQRRRGRFRSRLRRHHAQYLRHVRHAPHA